MAQVHHLGLHRRLDQGGLPAQGHGQHGLLRAPHGGQVKDHPPREGAGPAGVEGAVLLPDLRPQGLEGLDVLVHGAEAEGASPRHGDVPLPGPSEEGSQTMKLARIWPTSS